MDGVEVLDLLVITVEISLASSSRFLTVAISFGYPFKGNLQLGEGFPCDP